MPAVNPAEAFLYFFAFFRKGAFLLVEGKSFLDRAYEGSLQYAAQVGEELKDNVYEALRLLAEGFLRYPNSNLSEADLEVIRENTFVLIYRILFLFYAEDRGLLPQGTPEYDAYSVHTLAQEVAEKLDGREHLPPALTGYWARLNDLCRIVNDGGKEYGIADVPAYNGGLFDPAKHAQLAHWKIGDAYLAKAIDQLGRARASGRTGRGVVNYRDLDIRHLGGIYEGLLEHRPRLAHEPIAVVKENKREVFKPLRELDGVQEQDGQFYRVRGRRKEALQVYRQGEVYLETDKGERKATGSYYTPDYSVGDIL